MTSPDLRPVAAPVDALVYQCRQSGDDSTYALVRAVEAAHGVKAPAPTQAPLLSVAVAPHAAAGPYPTTMRPATAEEAAKYTRAALPIAGVEGNNERS